MAVVVFAKPGRRGSRSDDRQPDYPAELAAQLRLAGLPEPVREHAFAKGRRWRFDLAWPAAKIAVEVDGGTFTAGRHTRGVGFERDCEKLNAAVCLGWRCLRFTGQMIVDGRALDVLRFALLGAGS